MRACTRGRKGQGKAGRSAGTGIKGRAGTARMLGRQEQMPTAKAIHRLSWCVGDRLPKATAKSKGERVVTGAPLRRVICRDAVKPALTEKAPRVQR